MKIFCKVLVFSLDIWYIIYRKREGKTKMTIYFDMDGTIANLYGVDGWLDSIIKGHTKPYRLAKKMFNKETVQTIKTLKANGVKIGIVSWLAKGSTKEYDERVTKAKLNWLAKNFNFADEIHIVPYGTDKKSVVLDKNGYLVDDEIGNLKAWGNKTINATEMKKELKKFL